jgi:hypothetical protein
MTKKCLIFLLAAFSSTLGNCFEKLSPDYQISYGNPDAPIKVVEYFSFTCPKCLKFIREDFGNLKEKYIHSNQIHWTFHPDPADRLTLQAMICLRQLNAVQKRHFLEVISKNLEEKGLEVGCVLMQAAMEYFQHPLSELDKMTFLETTEEFRRAFAFLKQKDVITTVPTVEINGKIHDEFPDRKFLDKQFNLLLAKDALPCK